MKMKFNIILYIKNNIKKIEKKSVCKSSLTNIYTMSKRGKSPAPKPVAPMKPQVKNDAELPSIPSIPSTPTSTLTRLLYAVVAYAIIAIFGLLTHATQVAWFFAVFCLIKKPINYVMNIFYQQLDTVYQSGGFVIESFVLIVIISLTTCLIGLERLSQLMFWYFFCFYTEKVIAVVYFLILAQEQLAINDLLAIIVNSPKKNMQLELTINNKIENFDLGKKDIIMKQFDKGSKLIDLSKSHYVIPVFFAISMQYVLIITISGDSMLDSVSIENRINFTLMMISFFIVNIISLLF
jgi:hypothetical protein